jgi:hypothetical protein
MRRYPKLALVLPLSAVLVGLAACGDQTPAEPAVNDHAALHAAHSAQGAQAAHGAHGDLLKSVRTATARFNSTTQAIRAGYVPDDHCVAVPGLGGMGYHWANFDLVDPVFDPLQPEVMLYETGPGGNLRLIAVEYIVIDVGQPHPHFGDHPFDVGGTPVPEPHYSLHVWLHKDNPAGLFTPFNPNVTCP